MSKIKKEEVVGYSRDFISNPNYKKEGLLCEWEHCIEWMPVEDIEKYEEANAIELYEKFTCPIFGHICPGGVEMVNKCDKKASDIPKYRFIKGD